MSRVRKAPVKPEKRQEWLERYELKGESALQIARKDGYDVRTIRKQIEIVRQEEEAREARSIVLRTALEQHFEELRKFAAHMDDAIPGIDHSAIPDEELWRMALRQHLPRSPLWGYLAKLDVVQRAVLERDSKIIAMVKQAVKTDPRLLPMLKAGLDSIISNIIAILDSQSSAWFEKRKGLNLQANWHYETVGEKVINWSYGPFHFLDKPVLDKIHIKQASIYADSVKSFIVDLETRLKESEECREQQKARVEIDILLRKIREELAIIRLRRTVPGRCKYCPL